MKPQKTVLWQHSRKPIVVLKFLFLITTILVVSARPEWIDAIGLPILLLQIVFAYIGVTFGFNLLKTLAMQYYLKRHNFSATHRDSFTIVLRKVSKLVAHIVFVFVALYILGIQLRQFVTALSLFAVALVIMFTEQINKLINGLVVMFSKDFQVDDYIRVGDLEGRIQDVGFLHVELVSLSGDIVYVPNSVILNKETVNFSRKRTRAASIEVFVNAKSRQQAIDKANTLREKLLSAFTDVDKKSVHVTYTQDIPSRVKLTLEFRINTSSWMREREIERFLTLEAMDL